MCGINGFTFEQSGLVEKMNAATRHRGPDGTGVFSDGRVTLGQNLLAIVDTPENCRQPFFSEDGNFVLVYNGEIYNYAQLRSDLQYSDQFKTDTDTEVILKGLIRHGKNFLNKLDGMFALAFYDKSANRLILARDSGGMKPLYYHHDGKRLIFSSEPKGLFAAGIDKKLNLESFKVFYLLGYVPGAQTMFQGVNKVCPGQYIEFELNHSKLSSGYFGLDLRNENESIRPDDEMIREIIGHSVRQHTMGLRPFGLYLSGGLDSAIILHELAEKKELINTYTTRFETMDESLNQDADLAQRLTKDYNINHHEILVTESDFIEALTPSMAALQEPRYNFSVPAYWLLAKEASRDITVVLSGNGGDEIFLGYDRYLESLKLSAEYDSGSEFWHDIRHTLGLYKKGELKFGSRLHLKEKINRWSYLSAVKRNVNSGTVRKADFDLTELNTILKTNASPAVKHPLRDAENAMAEFDRLFWLADEEFLRTDRLTMDFGMEGRFPFLANDLIKFANSVSSKDKLSSGTKTLLRRAYREHLPDYIINKEKTGWYAPVVEWMDSKLGEMVKEVLSEGYYEPMNELFDLNKLRSESVEQVGRFNRSNIKNFYPIFTFLVWARSYGVKL